MTETRGDGAQQRPSQQKSDKQKTTFSHAHALVIAVANYMHVNPLPEAVLNDARDIADVLSSPEYCGYNPTQIKTLLDSDATLDATRQALADLASVSAESDTVFIFFSGHGARVKEGGDEASVLIPVGGRCNDLPGTSLSEAEFSKALAAIPAKRLVVVLDACHSGGAASLKQGDSTAVAYGFGEKSLQRLSQGTGRVIISSSRASETSLVLKDAHNSVFTGRLLEAFRGHAQTRGDGLVRVFEIFNYVAEKVAQTVPGRQHPTFKASDMEDDFPLVLDKGGAKTVTGCAPSPPASWRRLEELLASLYPAGPLDLEIWARAGGDISRLRLIGTGRSMWFSALNMLQNGGGGQNITTKSLLDKALEDFPQHTDLLALRVPEP